MTGDYKLDLQKNATWNNTEMWLRGFLNFSRKHMNRWNKLHDTEMESSVHDVRRSLINITKGPESGTLTSARGSTSVSITFLSRAVGVCGQSSNVSFRVTRPFKQLLQILQV